MPELLPLQCQQPGCGLTLVKVRNSGRQPKWCAFHTHERNTTWQRWKRRMVRNEPAFVTRLHHMPDVATDASVPSESELKTMGAVAPRIAMCDCGTVWVRQGQWRGDIDTCAECVAVNKRQHDTRKRVKGLAVFPYARTDVFERDGWTCHLCSKAIDPELSWPHPKFATVDHLVPVSKGGIDHIDNVKAAHLGCNSARGNRDLEQAG